MSFLCYFTDQDLRQLLVIKKVDISVAIDKVFPFLYGLRDKQLITAEKFKEISKARKQISKAMYSLLQWLEKSDSSTIRKFWLNLFQDYNLQTYPKLYPLQASLIEDLGKEVPVVKTELCLTGKRKYPDEECAHHSVTGRTQKDIKEQIPECSKDPNWKRSVEKQLVKKGDKQNATETRKPPSLLGKVDFGSNLLPGSCSGLTGVLDKTQPAPGKRSVEKQLVKKGDKQNATETRKPPSLPGKVDFGSNLLPGSCSGLTGVLDKTQPAPGKRSVEKQLVKKGDKQNATETRKPPSLLGKVDFGSNLLPGSCSGLTGVLDKTQPAPGKRSVEKQLVKKGDKQNATETRKPPSLLGKVDFGSNLLPGSCSGLTGVLDKTQPAPGKMIVEKQLTKKDDKPNVMKTRKPPSLLGKVGFDSNQLPVCRGGLPGLLDKTQLVPGKRSVEQQLTKKDHTPNAKKTRKSPSLLDNVNFDSNLQPVSCGSLPGLLDKTQLSPGKMIVEKQLTIKDHKPNATKTRKSPSLLDKVDFDSNQLPVSCGGLTGLMDKTHLVPDLGKYRPATVPVVKTGLCVTGKRKYADEECAHHSVSGRTQKDIKDQIPECSQDPNYLGKYRPATVPVVKTGFSVTGKRKYPDEECAHHSVSGRTQKDIKEQIPECSKDPNWKRSVGLQQAKKDGKPNATKTRKPPSLLGEEDFDSNLLPVSCGDITGLLDKTKLALGSREACIKYKDDWYTPREFEVKGGREKSKNWKVSIQCKGRRLSKLLELEYLICESPTKKGKVKAACAQEHIGLMKKSTIQCEDGSSDECRKGADAEDPEMADFSSNELPVACGSHSGILHKDRFITGINGKSIRTETKWLTPSEFENLSDIKKEIRYWKRNIHCKSETLGKLIQRGHLKLHKLDCLCEKCTSPPDCDSQNDDECTVCENRGKLICCDQCPKAFHFLCHVPSLSPNLSEKFICTFCKIGKLSANKTRANSEFGVHQTAMTPQYILKCEYILLQLYCKQVSVGFDKNPCEIIPNYSDVIENPMWLCKVKKRLATNEYRIVGGFIDDVRLISHNCARFNQDNEFQAFGRNLSDEFEEIMMQVFDISNSGLQIPQIDE